MIFPAQSPMDHNAPTEATIKGQLMECLENMCEIEDEIEKVEQEHVITAMQTGKKGAAKRRKGKRPLDQANVKTLHRSTRLNKDLKGFKDAGSAEAHEQAPLYAGHYDQASVARPPPHLSKENIQAIGTGFLKIHHVDVANAMLFASSDDDN
jgi:hypothetical protein